MIPVAYSVEDEWTSPKFARAFATGCGGSFTKENELQPGPIALFGSPKRWALLQQARAEGRTWFYADHAYFFRRVYFRITRNAYQHDCSGKTASKRFDDFRIPVQPWRTRGRHILICPNSPSFFELFGGQDCKKWLTEVKATLRRYSDRPQRVRYKNSAVPFEQDLIDAWACVSFVSICGVHAALYGVPSFATAQSASQAFGTDDLSKIENPVRPDNRLEMARVLAANQWSMHEIETGQAWASLQ